MAKGQVIVDHMSAALPALRAWGVLETHTAQVSTPVPRGGARRLDRQLPSNWQQEHTHNDVFLPLKRVDLRRHCL